MRSKGRTRKERSREGARGERGTRLARGLVNTGKGGTQRVNEEYN